MRESSDNNQSEPCRSTRRRSYLAGLRPLWCKWVLHSNNTQPSAHWSTLQETLWMLDWMCWCTFWLCRLQSLSSRLTCSDIRQLRTSNILRRRKSTAGHPSPRAFSSSKHAWRDSDRKLSHTERYPHRHLSSEKAKMFSMWMNFWSIVLGEMLMFLPVLHIPVLSFACSIAAHWNCEGVTSLEQSVWLMHSHWKN